MRENLGSGCQLNPVHEIRKHLNHGSSNLGILIGHWRPIPVRRWRTIILSDS